MDKKYIISLLIIFILFSIGIIIFLCGLFVKSSDLIYSSIGISIMILIIIIILYFKHMKKKIENISEKAQNTKIFNNPIMKKNKSDSNLELIAQENSTINNIVHV